MDIRHLESLNAFILYRHPYLLTILWNWFFFSFFKVTDFLDSFSISFVCKTFSSFVCLESFASFLLLLLSYLLYYVNPYLLFPSSFSSSLSFLFFFYFYFVLYLQGITILFYISPSISSQPPYCFPFLKYQKLHQWRRNSMAWIYSCIPYLIFFHH